MGFRFRKSVKLGKFARVNFSGSGASLSLGPRGASLNVSSRGTYVNMGIPGSGISYRAKITEGNGKGNSGLDTSASNKYDVRIDEQGELVFSMNGGEVVPPELEYTARREMYSESLRLLEFYIKHNCSDGELLANFYQSTPCVSVPQYTTLPFDDKPSPPNLKRHGVLSLLLPFFRRKVDEMNYVALAEYQQQLNDWSSARMVHEEKESSRKYLIERGIYESEECMEEYFESVLDSINWPRETLVSFQVFCGGTKLAIDVDLPELEDMPTEVARVVKEKPYVFLRREPISPSKQMKVYMHHVHGVALRLLGEAFSALPLLERVVISGYTQRWSSDTLQIEDEYIYSCAVERGEWMSLYDILSAGEEPQKLFANISRLRRKMTQKGKFTTIEPFEPTFEF
ncbi:DUF4236 domain-containing protein [Permianibacter aggregans]|uniref:Uncharacterized protein DUF4236 n=1 Tax=Permianibacter aggregans TaxID=1510150 RepID=A0A4R6UFE7_9GAMM|nr:DUF4236 domain-containing protein [Permianibacter aggregans]QGX40722.1 DUF4236 domain-containing protein [Permianibacter aggregans]TDQ41844.1 uncharacterized protein DUF4236 [Permianibacter aggregans]